MAAVGERQLDHFRGTAQTGLLTDGEQEGKIHRKLKFCMSIACLNS